jgi:RNA recognition motif-containing protein
MWPADSGRPKGFGFIEFLDIRDAEEAIYNLDRTTFGGREIQVGGWGGGPQ